MFYPISKDHHNQFINKPGRNTLWLRNGDKTLLGLARAADGHTWAGKGSHMPLPIMRFLRKVKMDTLTNGELDSSFITDSDINDRKITPIIFSHSLSSNRTMFSGICLDFASHGFMVFVMDHKDGSSSYTESEDGE